ncbi:MAG: aldo/keto reductase, partial [Anaerolineae bacterium]|nr:aldo/keto reductase [Anaerolineae bacterium]
SEEVVARALKGRADKPYIFTKCERVWNEKGEISNSLKADSIRRECEASLRRLQVDVIDLYQIHWPDPDADIEEGWTTLAQLQQEGKVRWIGVSNFNVAQMKRAQNIAPVTSLQPPYSLVNRGVEDEILPYALEQHIGVINYSPMGAGLLTGAMTRERIANLPADDWRKRGGNFQEPRLSRHLALVDILKGIAEKHGRTPGEVAIAWTLHNPAITAAIVGARNAGQIDGIIGAMDFRLSEDEFEQIEAFCRANP